MNSDKKSPPFIDGSSDFRALAQEVAPLALPKVAPNPNLFRLQIWPLAVEYFFYVAVACAVFFLNYVLENAYQTCLWPIYVCFVSNAKKTLYKVDIDEVGWKSAGCCFGVAGLSFVLYQCYLNCNSVQTFISGLVPVPLLAAPLRHAIINEPREGFVFSFLLFGVIGRI